METFHTFQWIEYLVSDNGITAIVFLEYHGIMHIIKDIDIFFFKQNL